MTKTDTAVWILGIVLIIGFLGFGIASAAGLSNARAPSEYSGHVVDVEQDRGTVFRTTQLNMKTHPQASSSETFCIQDGDEEILETAKNATRNNDRVTIEYSRPYFVWIGDCESDTSIVQDITVTNQSANESAA